MAEFKYNLRNLRIQADITARKLAREIGVCPSAVSEWEKGPHAPSRKNLEKLAQYFGVSMDYLLGSENPEVLLNEKHRQLLSLFDSLPEDDQAHALSYMNYLKAKK